ncbi:response regulator transcription factor [Proteiniborus sp. MB09-C3]|uniref:response regulator transcription factor n=1 Tax=Proteiniborus sp. MB09-C3 TaxID=3050072 RepID=UPI002556C10F|nr:response regulator transcription factor [Proteiniborus sp. MB09-C3]WIV12662.1 response regulator transcription factor [Proteiniborus sp. MB09-C3]
MEEIKTKVLVVEDEASIRKFISINLNRAGFQVMEAESSEKALEIINEFNPDVAILDVMLPGIDGFTLCNYLRNQSPNMVIIMLTARGQDTDKINGLEIGADDYMVKPFNPMELIARINANIRKIHNVNRLSTTRLSLMDMEIDLGAQRFFRKEEEIELTPTEFAIMKMFIQNPDKALSRHDILDLVWGKNYFGDIKIVDVNVRRIREKIEDNPSEPKIIETVWGVGYRLRGES